MQIRVYYEDTDAAGVVYYANYLKFCERARTEFFRDRGVEVAEWYGKGILFVVAHAEISYRAPAVYNDLLEIETELKSSTRASFTFSQRILRAGDGAELCLARIKLACIDGERKPRRIPEEVNRVILEAISASTNRERGQG